MAQYEETIRLSAQDDASAIIDSLNAKIADLEKALEEIRRSQSAAGFVVSDEMAAQVINNITDINSGLQGLNQKMEETANRTVDVDNGFAQNLYYTKEVIGSYWALQEQMVVIGAGLAAVAGAFVKYPAEMATAIKTVIGWTVDLKLKLLSIPFEAGGALAKFFIETLPNTLNATSSAFQRVSARVTQFAADYLKLGTLSGLAGIAADVLIIKEFAEASINASNAVKDMTLSLGNLSKDFTDFDKDTYALEVAKKRYELLNDASYTLRTNDRAALR